MKRIITLYWSSIGLWVSFATMILWLFFFWVRPKYLRNKLQSIIKNIYADSDYFMFGSARSALSFYLSQNFKPGDEVVISAYTCLAVPTALIAANLVPVYVDINPDNLAISEEKIWSSISSKTKAIVVQHTLGNPAPIISIISKARSLGIVVIEDCALSIGTRINDKFVGFFGDAAIYSMELSKILSCGWGGILQINNKESLEKLNTAYLLIPEQSFFSSTKDLFQTFISTWTSHPFFLYFPGKYIYWLIWRLGLFRYSTPANEFYGLVEKDFVRKMGPAQSILALLQWKRFNYITSKCSKNYKIISTALIRAGYEVHIPKNESIQPVSNRVSFITDNRIKLISSFKKRGIELGLWFDGPLSPIPNEKIFNYYPGNYPVAEKIANLVLNIPSHNRISDQDLDNILLCIEENKIL